MHFIELITGKGLDSKGQGLTEYVLVLVLIAVVIILMVTGLGASLNNTYSTINSTMP